MFSYDALAGARIDKSNEDKMKFLFDNVGVLGDKSVLQKSGADMFGRLSDISNPKEAASIIFHCIEEHCNKEICRARNFIWTFEGCKDFLGEVKEKSEGFMGFGGFDFTNQLDSCYLKSGARSFYKTIDRLREVYNKKIGSLFLDVSDTDNEEVIKEVAEDVKFFTDTCSKFVECLAKCYSNLGTIASHKSSYHSELLKCVVEIMEDSDKESWEDLLLTSGLGKEGLLRAHLVLCNGSFYEVMKDFYKSVVNNKNIDKSIIKDKSDLDTTIGKIKSLILPPPTLGELRSQDICVQKAMEEYFKNRIFNLIEFFAEFAQNYISSCQKRLEYLCIVKSKLEERQEELEIIVEGGNCKGKGKESKPEFNIVVVPGSSDTSVSTIEGTSPSGTEPMECTPSSSGFCGSLSGATASSVPMETSISPCSYFTEIEKHAVLATLKGNGYRNLDKEDLYKILYSIYNTIGIDALKGMFLGVKFISFEKVEEVIESYMFSEVGNGVNNPNSTVGSSINSVGAKKVYTDAQKAMINSVLCLSGVEGLTVENCIDKVREMSSEYKMTEYDFISAVLGVDLSECR